MDIDRLFLLPQQGRIGAMRVAEDPVNPTDSPRRSPELLVKRRITFLGFRDYRACWPVLVRHRFANSLHGRRTRVVGASAIAVIIGLAGPAAADLKTDVETKLVETQKRAAPDLVVGKATCPAPMAKAAAKTTAATHRCSVLVEGVSVPYDVTIRANSSVKGGTYTLANAKAVIDMRKLVAIASTVVDNPATAKITCGGKARVVVAEPGAKVTCVVIEGPNKQTLTFAVQDLRGVVSLVV
jgi:hypothetical protein